jgi:hypothetical protein
LFLNKEFKLRKICFPNLPHTKKKEKHIKIDDKRVLCSYVFLYSLEMRKGKFDRRL